MDKDLVLIDKCDTETMDSSSMPTSPISPLNVTDTGLDVDSIILESKYNTIREEDAQIRRALKFGVPPNDRCDRASKCDSAANTIGNQPSGSKDFCLTQAVNAGDQFTGRCANNTKQSPLGTNSRPGIDQRKKPIRAERSGCGRPRTEEIGCNLKSMSPALDSLPPPPSSPFSPPFSPPPPPPPLSYQPCMNLPSHYIQAPPPPPLPPLPPPPQPSYAWPQYPPEFEVRTAENLIPVRSAEMSAYNTTSPIVGIAPFRRKVLLMRHQAHAADYQEYEWLLRFADTGAWYEKPSRFQLSGSVGRMMHPQPMCMELPKVWASAALTTSLDNATTVVDPCRSKTLKTRPLVYCLVLSTDGPSLGSSPGRNHGFQMYKLVRCGSREAAVTEAFFAAGVHGYNVAFACVMRLDEDFTGSFVKAKKVDQLSDLALENYSREDVRVFY